MAFEEEKQYYCDKCHRTMSSDNFYKSNNLENTATMMVISTYVRNVLPCM